MAKNNKAYDKEFREEILRYCADHPDLTDVAVGKQFGVHPTTIGGWKKKLKEQGKVIVRGSGNYESDEAKEIARLRKEVRDYKDALEVLKKAISILGQ